MLATWNEIYSNSAIWRTLVLFSHVGGLLLGAGCAVAADRLTLLAQPGDTHQLKALAGVHRVVLIGLVFMGVSGLLMVGADLDHYLTSKWFWTKMALVVLLLLNGVRLARAEQGARAAEPQAWSRLRSASLASLVLWFLVTFFGAVLPNV